MSLICKLNSVAFLSLTRTVANQYWEISRLESRMQASHSCLCVNRKGEGWLLHWSSCTGRGHPDGTSNGPHCCHLLHRGHCTSRSCPSWLCDHRLQEHLCLSPGRMPPPVTKALQHLPSLWRIILFTATAITHSAAKL